MEVVELHILEFRLGRGKQFFGALYMFIHGAADIQQHQDLDIVFAFRLHLDVEIAGIIGSRTHRVVE
ncbi:hypothetical protein D3C81_1814440 [compost metagenome]